ncbi:c-type cytochrome [Zunongwangia sp.]|uniref:c-type cytochrome n=1 Tax=Zunongwangia sp. TaxID=1965325 RepID=UPI003AA92434
MKSLLYKSLVFSIIVTVFSSCADDNHRNYQYFPDMYRPVPYEAYGEYDVFAKDQEAQLPVEGTIPRGWMPYEYENTPEGRELAKSNLKNPLPYTEKNLTKGKELYTLYCAVCHGDKGDGKGKLVEREKILGVPAYDDMGRGITEGSAYHAMYYGLNNMGSYAVQTSIKERWQIDHYVMSLKDKLEGNPERPFETPTETQEISENLNPAEPSETPSHDQTVNGDNHNSSEE